MDKIRHFEEKSFSKLIITPRVCNLNEFSRATCFFLLCGLGRGGPQLKIGFHFFVFKNFFFFLNNMGTCDQQEKVLSSQQVLLGIFLQIKKLS